MLAYAVVTGRGNNTLADKNIREVNGKPLIYYPTISALNSKLVDKVFVSSDDKKIRKAVNGLDVIKIYRPKELSQPDSKHIDVIEHAVGMMQDLYQKPDILIVLLANTVTVKSEWITSCVLEIINDPTIDSVVPVYLEQDHHPFRAKKINSDGFLEPWFEFGEEAISTNRQELPDNYFLGHNFWVLNLQKRDIRDRGQKPWTFLGNKIKPFVIDECFDVHTEYDLERCQKWLLENA